MFVAEASTGTRFHQVSLANVLKRMDLSFHTLNLGPNEDYLIYLIVKIVLLETVRQYKEDNSKPRPTIDFFLK